MASEQVNTEQEEQKALLVFTDLDGTLLDHHDYSFSAADTALKALAVQGIPLIINTSKTCSEVMALREQLNNLYRVQPQPFVVENGAGIYLPQDSDFSCRGLQQTASGLLRLDLATPRESVLDILHAIRREHGLAFTGFADMSVADVQRETGLSEAAAKQALARDYTEPLLWQDSEEARQQLVQSLRAKGLQILEGGRFWHVMSAANKGKAMQVLSSCYKQPATTIALGDGGNDIAMLEAADWPVVIKAASKASLKLAHKNAIYSKSEGPVGWNTTVQDLLTKLT